MNIKKIQELIELMTENDLTEIEIDQEGTKIKLIRKLNGGYEQQIVHAPVQQVQPVAAPAAQPLDATKEAASNYSEVKSPMVGTFYCSPTPDADPYVKVGDVVNKGDVLCIIEAMKMMNEVKSEFSGTIVNIAVENTEPVEHGQVLFSIDPA